MTNFLIIQVQGNHLFLRSGMMILSVVLFIIFINWLQVLRLKRKGITDNILRQWHDNPANWKAGLFYYNPQDPRILPPKRIAWAGWTINFANPLSIIGVIVLLVFVFMLLGYFEM